MNTDETTERSAKEIARDKSPLTGRGLFIAGVILSVVYLLTIAIFWRSPVTFSRLPPNELGDFLAGVFAPLAFFWLVLGFIQQGRELRNSASALWLQMDELRNSVKAQNDLVEATRDLRELEASIHASNKEEAARSSAPLLSMRATGSQTMGSPRARNYTFNLHNDGPTCTALTVFDGSDMLRSVGRLDSGSFSQITLGKETNFEGTVILRAEYIDARSTSGATEWEVDFLNGHVAEVRKVLLERA